MNAPSLVPRAFELPEPEAHSLLTIGDTIDEGGFIRRRSRRLKVRSVAGIESLEFDYDEVSRRAFDAVVVLPYFREDGEDWVILRTAIRPPILLREPVGSALPKSALGVLWEVPAGLVEPEESHASGLRKAASRELFEETGFLVEAGALSELGPPLFPCPGVIGETQFFFGAEVKVTERTEPALDGSPLEEFFELCAVPLRAALAAAREGKLRDAKSELILRRFAETRA